MGRPRLRVVLGAALIVLVAAAAGLVGYVETRAVRTSPAARTHSHQVPAALRAATVAPPGAGSPGHAPVPSPSRLAALLAPALRASGLGGSVRARIVDAASGRVLLTRGADSPGAPASTAKLLTAAALFSVRRPTDRLTTVVDAGRSGTVVLVGGGDPTLTAARRAADAAYPHAARLAGLAAAVRRSGVPVRRVVVDDGRFAGPTTSPAWQAEDVPSSYGSGITALMTDGGRASPGAVVRSATPDLAAGREFAALLGHPHLPVSRGTAAPGARRLGSVRSAPLGTLVDQMLMGSDNVIAECLGRQVAIATGRPASFSGAAAAIRAVLARAGIDVGHGMVDASGLAARDRLTATALASVIRGVASPPAQHVAWRSILAGLPVAAWSGTLEDRYVNGSSRAAAGRVRAKTGTLTGVSTLVGLVHDRSGRLVVLALLADRTRSTPAAEAALDRIATDVAGCGCG